jgi:hypothetical protein
MASQQTEIEERLDMLVLQTMSIGFDTDDESSQYDYNELDTVSEYPTLTP